MAREVKKRVKNAILYADGTIKLMGVRFSYPHLDKPYKGDNDSGEAKFGVVGMMPKKTHKEAKQLVQDRIDELLKENKVKKLPADKLFLRDGDDSSREEYEDHWTVSARETRRPPLRDRRNEVVEPEDAKDVFQPGFWGDILIRPWYQNNKFGKRVNAGLSSVQFVRKDETFGEGRISDEDLDDTFEDYGDEDEDEDRGSSRSRRSRDEDEDDDDRGSRRSRRRSRDDDDDDDDDRSSRRSRSRRRSRDDDEDEYDDDI